MTPAPSPTDQITDVIYRDLVADPVAVIERLYAALGPPRDRRSSGPPSRPTSRPATPTAAAATTTPSPTPGSTWPTHRALVAPYQERFGVPSEV